MTNSIKPELKSVAWISLPKAVAASSRIFRLLLHLYPASFRREFGREMAQVFRDETQQTLRESGLAGFFTLWLTVLFDLGKTALAEHLWELLHQPQHNYVRWGGVTAAIGGIIWLMPWFLPWTSWVDSVRETTQLWISLLGLVLVAPGMAGLYLKLKRSGSRLSTSALGLTLVGLALVFLPVVFALFKGPTGYGGAFRVVVAGAICFVLGLVVMGVIALYHQALGALSFVPLALAGGYFSLVMTIWVSRNFPPINFLIPVLIMLNFMGWLLFGVALWVWSRKVIKPLI